MHRRGEESKAIAPAFLGRVHRLIGVLLKRRQIRRVGRKNRDPEARRNLETPSCDLEGGSKFGDEPFPRTHRPFGVVETAQADDEFVAAQPSQHIVTAHDTCQPARRFDEDVVAGLVPAGIVDHLEVIEIQEDDGHQPLVALRMGEQIGQPILGKTPVRKAGQGIEEDEPFDVFFRRAELRGVGEDGNMVLDLAGRVADHGDGQPFGIDFTVLAPVFDLAPPGAGRLHRRP